MEWASQALPVSFPRREGRYRDLQCTILSALRVRHIAINASGAGNGVPGRACTCGLHLRRVALYLFELREQEESAGPNTPHRVGSLTSSGAL